MADKNKGATDQTAIKGTGQQSVSPLSPLAEGERELRREFRRRNSIWELKTIKNEDEVSNLAEGWLVHKRLKTKKIKLQRERPIDERLENKWWVLLYKMGYHEMNIGPQFRVLLKRKNDVEGAKQIDIYARDDESVIVTECKASDRLRPRSLQKDIEEFGSLKGDISASIKRFYGPEFKPKILWFFVTENIIWSEEDSDRAKANGIRRVTELELPYYTQLVEHLGHAARYQFLAEFLKDQKIPEMEGIKIPATRGKVGGQTFYSFVTTARHLLKIAFVNHRTLDDPEGHPTYQRLVQKGRLRDIGAFIQAGGYFPNNLLVNFIKPPRYEIIQKDLLTDVHYGHLYLPSTYKSAWIIDGQHRLYGYANLADKFLDNKLMVVAFEGMKKEDEANLFVTINHEQRSVPKTLLDDLEGQLKWGSDDPAERVGAMGARLIQQLNRDLGSPFYNRFSAEGLKSTDKVCLTIPQVKLALKRSGLLGRPMIKVYERGPLCGGTDNASLMRAQKVINAYFGVIQNADMARWDRGRPGKLCTNEAVQAFLLLLGEMITYLYKNDSSKYLRLSEVHLLKDVAPLLDPVCDFIKTGGTEVDKVFTVPFGSGGPREYLFRLAKIVRSSYPDFSPQDFDDWEIAQSQELKEQADRQLQVINILVQKHIFTVFRFIYGEARQAYWEKGVTDKEMKAGAYKASMDYEPDERGPLEVYLNFISYKKIIEHKDRWRLFKSAFDIQLPGIKGQAKNVDWMDRINELRRVSAHAAEGRSYKSEDFPFIDHVWKVLKERIEDFDYASVSQGALSGKEPD